VNERGTWGTRIHVPQTAIVRGTRPQDRGPVQERSTGPDARNAPQGQNREPRRRAGRRSGTWTEESAERRSPIGPGRRDGLHEQNDRSDGTERRGGRTGPRRGVRRRSRGGRPSGLNERPVLGVQVEDGREGQAPPEVGLDGRLQIHRGDRSRAIVHVGRRDHLLGGSGIRGGTVGPVRETVGQRRADRPHQKREGQRQGQHPYGTRKGDHGGAETSSKASMIGVSQGRVSSVKARFPQGGRDRGSGPAGREKKLDGSAVTIFPVQGIPRRELLG